MRNHPEINWKEIAKLAIEEYILKSKLTETFNRNIGPYVLMGTMKIVIPDEVEEQLRRYIAIHKGMRKGAISESVLEAIQLWLQSPDLPPHPDKFRVQFPGKYLAVAGEEVVIVADTLGELFEKVTSLSEKVYIIHPEPEGKRIRLGWRSQVKS